MLKVYNDSKEFLGILENLKDVIESEDLVQGARKISFLVPLNDTNLSWLMEENYIESSNYSYIIKEINIEDNDYIEVHCDPNYEDIQGFPFYVFSAFDISLEAIYKKIVEPAGWKVKYNSVHKTKTEFQRSRKNGLELLRELAELYRHDLWFDTKEKMLYVYDNMGKDAGILYSNELQLHEMKKQSSTYDFATCLYPYGKDDLSISSINNGIEYIENYKYSNKKITSFWFDDSYTHAEDLLAAARIKLEEMAKPRASYELTLTNVNKDIQLGDIIIVVDRFKKIKQKYRVVAIERNIFNPEKSKIQISNNVVDFTDEYAKSQKLIGKKIEDLDQYRKEMEKRQEDMDKTIAKINKELQEHLGN